MRLLFFFTKPYSVSILEPIEIYCKSLSEIEVARYKAGSAKHIDVDGLVLNNSEEVLDFKPPVIIAPGNIVLVSIYYYETKGELNELVK